MTRSIFGLSLLLSLLPACDDASDGASDAGPGDGGDSSAPEWISDERRSPDLNRYLEAFCRHEARCLSYGSFHECNLNSLGTVCGGSTTENVKVENLQACLSALAERACDAGVISECLGARNALRASGDNRLLAQGEACGPSNVIRCDFDLYCDAEPNACGICRKQGGRGDTCRDSSECFPDKYYCADGACVPRLAAGQACDPLAFACELGLTCSDEGCAPQQSEDMPAPIGAACNEDANCYSNTCDAGKCVARTRCRSGQEGDRCSSQYSCEQGFACGGEVRRCVPALERGAACDPTAALCALGDFCLDGTCKAQLANGETCEYGSTLYSPECASGFCGPSGKCGPQEIVCPDE